MIAFTICSNNYLPKARLLGESLVQHNPEVRFIIGLVDELDSAIDYQAVGPFEILPVDQIGIPDFEDMTLRYDLVDFNTASKPFYFRFLFQRHAGEKNLKICYFDPDIYVYSQLKPIEEALERCAVLLTPHILSPIATDGMHPKEQGFLAFGLYNLGFCAIRQGPKGDEVVDWWAEHLKHDCRYDCREGLFVDQAWMDLAPIFFEGVEFSRHPGLNAAYWNLHERRIELKNGQWLVNNEWPLVFFHFSDLAPKSSEAITRTPNRFTLRERPELKPLFDEYRSKLEAYDFNRFRALPCYYIQRRAGWLREQQRVYHRQHPFRWLISMLKRSFPKKLKEIIHNA
jgi:hypothetical protein